MAPISEIIFSGFVSKIVNNGVDASWVKIKKVIKSNKTEHQNMESQIYSIIVNALNQITFSKFENNQDQIYQAAEKLLLGYKKVKSDDIEILRSGLQVLGKNVNNDIYIDFKGKIYDEISKKENVELYHTILLWLLDQKNKYDQLELEQLNQKLDVVLKILGSKDTESNLQYVAIKGEVKSRTQEYADKWNENMFLNNFDKRDENAGVNIKLSEVYLEKHLPHYIWGDNQNARTDLGDLLREHIYSHDDSKMLLILGQPGIGKSTLVTWITANFNDRINDIFVFKFTSDLGSVNWQDGRISNRILEKLNLNYEDLAGKTLILDGFDEVNIEANKRQDILDDLYGDWIYSNTIKNFSLVITCRENYVQQFAILKCKYITLQPWDEIQIRSFCNIFHEKTKNNISENTIEKLLQNKKILGIPLILYMVLALNISIEREGSIVDVYDKIFSLDGGIYDRCIDFKSFSEKHRIGEIKEQIHQISRDIAIWMFENNPINEYIPQNEYQKICVNVMEDSGYENEDLKWDYLIGNFLGVDNYCVGFETGKLYFVHRSIYQYFVVETIYSSIENYMVNCSDEMQKSFIGNITNYLKAGQLDITMGEFFKYKILKLYYKMTIDKKEMFWRWWEVAVEKMMKQGMLYYVNSDIRKFDYIAIHEAICFRNIMYVLSLISDIYPQNIYILSTIEEGLLKDYVNLYSKVDFFSLLHGVEGKRLRSLNIQKTVFIGKDYCNLYLAGANFSGSNFTNQNLKKSKLSNADFSNAILINANLAKADLQYANMKGADLQRADLRGADFEGAKIEDVNLEDAKIEGSIWTGEDIIKIRHLLKKADFDYIKLQYIHGQERIHKDKLYSL